MSGHRNRRHFIEAIPLDFLVFESGLAGTGRVCFTRFHVGGALLQFHLHFLHRVSRVAGMFFAAPIVRNPANDFFGSFAAS